MDSWVKLYSKFRHWRWYKNQNIKSLFIHCLLSANWKDGKFENVEIPRGSFVTSLSKLSEELGLSLQATRTALRWLKSTQELTVKHYSKFSVISINNYEKYQESNTILNTQLTQYQQALNTVLTTIEEYKNIDNNIKERIYNACACAREKEKFKNEKEEVFEYDWLNDEIH
nr:MAG TPA: DNA polymerase [Crassvirales sp.]